MNFVLKYSKCARCFKKMTFKLSSTHLFTLSFVNFFSFLVFSHLLFHPFSFSSSSLFVHSLSPRFTSIFPIRSFTRSFIPLLLPYFSWFIRSLVNGSFATSSYSRSSLTNPTEKLLPFCVAGNNKCLYYILCVDISVIKPWIKMIPVKWYDIISLVKWYRITSRVWIVQSNGL